MNRFYLIIIVIIITISFFTIINKYFKEKTIFHEIKLPEPLYEP